MREAFTNEETVACWARRFLAQLSELPASDWPSLLPLPAHGRAALFSQALEWALSQQSNERRVAASVLGELGVVTDAAVERLLKLTKDGESIVREEAAVALGGAREFADQVLPRLVELLGDAEPAVQIAALWAIQDFGNEARACQNILRRIVLDPEHPLREPALDALPWIDSRDETNTRLFMDSLGDARAAVRAAAASSLGVSVPESEQVRSVLARQLVDPEEQVAFFCVWALGRYGQVAEPFAPAVLHRLRTMDWVNHRREELPDGPDLRETLRRLLQPIPDDVLLEDFRLQFFSRVFHADAERAKAWIDSIVEHPWLRKLQRARFPRASTRAKRDQLADRIAAANAKFAFRLWKNPTLGLTPERYRELPGYIKNHLRNTAWRMRQRERSAAASLGVEPAARGPAPDKIVETIELRDTLAGLLADLPAIEATVLRCRFFESLSIAATAQRLGLSESQVKTLIARALSAARKRLTQGAIEPVTFVHDL